LTLISGIAKTLQMSERPRPSLESIYGTLPDWALREYIKSGAIKIEPLASDWEERLGPVTIDFHLNGKILVPKSFTHSYIDVKKEGKIEDYEVVSLDPGGPHLLKKGQFIIAHTKERLSIPPDIIGRLEGKSSLARLGVVIHLTAGRFDPGWSEYPVLELKNNSDLDVFIYEGMEICAFSFERLMAPVERPWGPGDRYADGTMHSQINTDHR
jgi:dCTP deaminase